jgi:uncharacterized protein YegL
VGVFDNDRFFRSLFLVITTGCGKADIVFIVDSSGSINDRDSNNWNLVLGFMQEVVSTFTIGSDAVRIGAILYSEFAEVRFYLDEHFDAQSVNEAIGNFPYLDSFTNTADGLELMNNVFVSDRGDRENVQNIAILITDGQANMRIGEEFGVATSAKERGISILSIGVTESVDLDELRAIASSDDQVVEVEDFSKLRNKVEQVMERSCVRVGKYVFYPLRRDQDCPCCSILQTVMSSVM